MARAVAAVAVAVAVLAAAVVAMAGSAAATDASTTANVCTFASTPTNVTITIENHCGASAKIRTCSDKFKQCSGYPSQPNFYQDCPERVPNGTTQQLM